VAPSVSGQPKLKPALLPVLGPLQASSISSHVLWPTSLMKIRPVAFWMSNVNGLRSPSAQIARLDPVVLLKNGLSIGIDPSALIRWIFPASELVLWALPLEWFSPTATYSRPSGPKPSAPPLW
jgi:hypothetical protein